MSKKGELRCSCGRRLVYVRMDGSGRCHICGNIASEDIKRQKERWGKEENNK